MSTKSKDPVKDKSESTLREVRGVLYAIEDHLNKILTDVEDSSELIKIGEKTSLALRIEDSIKNPFKNMLAVSNRLDTDIKDVINHAVKIFLQKISSIILSAHRTDVPNLHYSVVLKEDNFKNRKKLFEFYRAYDDKIAEKFPVFFQVVPQELIHKINLGETIIEAKETLIEAK